jgi:hypothetical protein
MASIPFSCKNGVNMNKVRLPNAEELTELKKYFLGLFKDEETVNLIIENHFFAVFDNYISDCPAYVGKLMVAVYGMPEFYEVFVWNDGVIKRVELDDGFYSKKRKVETNVEMS